MVLDMEIFSKPMKYITHLILFIIMVIIPERKIKVNTNILRILKEDI